MNFEHYNIGREAGNSPWAIRANGLRRLGELRAAVPCSVLNAQEENSSDSAGSAEQQYGLDSTRSGFWSRVVAWVKRLFVSLRNVFALLERS